MHPQQRPPFEPWKDLEVEAFADAKDEEEPYETRNIESPQTGQEPPNKRPSLSISLAL